MKKIFLWIMCLGLLLAAGCGRERLPSSDGGGTSGTAADRSEPSGLILHSGSSPDSDVSFGEESETESKPGPETEPEPEPEPEPEFEAASEPESLVVVLDPGHQSRGNSEPEPVGPGASETKAKVSSGTQGRFTGVPEYQVNLEVALLLRDELEDRGYTVILTRESSDVDISNAERAAIANEAGAGAFVRIHCDGSEDSSAQGASAICPTPDNPYPVGGIYGDCRLLADQVLAGLTEAAGARSRAVWETDTMSGLNWCEVPSIIVEMGFLTNQEEDIALTSPEYQARLARGMADGIDRYFSLREQP